MSTTIKARVGDLKGMGALIRDVDPRDHACEQCGHPWQEHVLCAASRPPTEGWIECPVEGCECHQTWSVPADTAAELRRHYVASKSDT
jgi:hypothetical protein